MPVWYSGRTAGLQMNLYYDVFEFPWLKYRVDAPSAGRDLLIQVNYQPDKNWRFNAMYKNERKELNAGISGAGTHAICKPVVQRWRIETDYSLSRVLGFYGQDGICKNGHEFFYTAPSGVFGNGGFAYPSVTHIRKYFSNDF